MKSKEIRSAFLRYFEERGHQVVASAPLVPEGDPTLMFVNAGMVPFKRLFLGEESRPYTRAASSQKCMRVSGKHNDLEEVGRSPSHQTLFEMLGNFSFGDYFKREAIELGWEFLTRVLGLDPDDLVVSVHKDDDEAYALWRDEVGLEERRIFRLGDSENFWQMGDTGPCGPCSEIHVILDRDAFERGVDPSQDGYMEIWNLVFMQFDQLPDGTRKPLPKPSVDTGMGLERITCVLQHKTSNYDTDLFQPLIQHVARLAGRAYGDSPESDVSMRVVADHARACTFLIGDGVLPSNEGRGYVLRRVLRRAARHGVLLGLEEPFLFELCGTVIDEMGEAYPDVVPRRAFVQDTVRREEERFLRTLGRGLTLLDEEIARARSEGRSRLDGDVVFKLYDTYGFPTDLTEDILRGHALGYDRAGFDACMQEQSERARAAWKGSGQSAPAEVYGGLGPSPCEFVGYQQLQALGQVLRIVRGGVSVEQAGAGERVELIVDRTPFYGESGGQVGDAGEIVGPSGRMQVSDTQKPLDGVIVHQGEVKSGSLRVGESVELRVDAERRAATVRNHSATHLFHWALRKVLGPQVQQRGSLVAPDRLRFDFTHDEPLRDDQVREIEDLVNGLIVANLPGTVQEKPYTQALEDGAIAIFEEKYGDRVRVVSFGGVSVELCGGTHARATGDIGSFRITGQSAIGAGLRRIEAQTGLGALEHARQESTWLADAAGLLRTSTAEVPGRIQRLLDRQRELERELEQTRAALRRGGARDPLQSLREVGGIKTIAARVDDAQPKELRSMIDELKQRIGSGVVLLASVQDDKAALAMGVTADLTDRIRADACIRTLAAHVGGKGGGRPDFAQAGGSRVEGVGQALEQLTELVEGLSEAGA